MVSRSSDSVQIKDLDSWKSGLVSYFSKGRLPEGALNAANNVIYDYDGIVRSRGSFQESSIPDTPDNLTALGGDFPYRRLDGTNGLVSVQSDGTDGNAYVLKSDLSGWTKMTTTFDKSAQVSMAQIVGKVVIGNGVDMFSYYDMSDNTVKRFAKVDDPTTAPTLTASNFSGTAAFDYYYRVSFNGIGGGTKMSPAKKQSSSTLRETWTNDNKSIEVDISGLSPDADATEWSIWCSMVTTGSGAPATQTYFNVSGPIDIATTSFNDKGTSKVISQKAPVENSTQGVKAKYVTAISGRLWTITDDGKIAWGGDVGHELYFGTDHGSDTYELDKNGIEVPMAIVLGRDNSGTTCINILTRTTAGLGGIWDVYATTNQVSVGDTTLSTGAYQFKKREGNDGTDAPFSVISQNNNAYYLSMDGFKSTGVKPNISGIQSTDIVSTAIRDKVLNLSRDNLNNVYVAYYNQAIYWTIAYGQSENNQIWVYDILHGGIWSIWDIQADNIFRWSVSSDDSPSLYIRQGKKILRYFKNSKSHKDASGVFTSYISTGLIPFKDNRLEWVHVLKNIWQFDRVTGTLKLTCNIHAKDGEIIKSSPVDFTVTSLAPGDSGWDAITLDDFYGGWNSRQWDMSYASDDIIESSTNKKVDQKVRKNAAYVSYSIQANTENTYYELSHISILFTYIGLGIEFLSQRGVIKI